MRKETGNKRRNLRGWEILYFASLLYLLNGIFGGAAGNILGTFGLFLIFTSVVVGILNIIKKRTPSKPVFTISMTILSIFVLFLAAYLKGKLLGHS